MSCAVVIPGMLRDDTCILHDALRLKKGEQERKEGRTDGRKGRKEGRKEGIYKKGRQFTNLMNRYAEVSLEKERIRK